MEFDLGSSTQVLLYCSIYPGTLAEGRVSGSREGGQWAGKEWKSWDLYSHIFIATSFGWVQDTTSGGVAMDNFESRDCRGEGSVISQHVLEADRCSLLVYMTCMYVLCFVVFPTPAPREKRSSFIWRKLVTCIHSVEKHAQNTRFLCTRPKPAHPPRATEEAIDRCLANTTNRCAVTSHLADYEYLEK